jgi:HEAT repeat protein
MLPVVIAIGVGTLFVFYTSPAYRDSEEGLIQRLRSADADERYTAVLELGQMRSRAALPGLEAALSDPVPTVRRMSAVSLGLIGDGRSAPALIRALQDVDWQVRRQAVWALALLKDASLPMVIRPMLADPQVEVRQMSAVALAERGDASGAPVLRDMLRCGDAELVSVAVHSATFIPQEDFSAELGKLTESGDPDTRRAASDAIKLIDIRRRQPGR